MMYHKILFNNFFVFSPADSQIPWLGAGIGIIIGVIIVISDQIATKKPTLTVSNTDADG